MQITEKFLYNSVNVSKFIDAFRLMPNFSAIKNEDRQTREIINFILTSDLDLLEMLERQLLDR